ncbi:MAG: hypothetical protein LC802_01180 [Acidobacteria bacterium]|nr:hypothetical protein [Acidobacteriota bacterium]
MMKRRSLSCLIAVLLLSVFSATALAAVDEDTDTRLIDAKVVEVNEHHISVIARTGVEHVIAVENSKTLVRNKGIIVALKDLREGDIVTVELDAVNPLKFARNIVIAVQANSEVATTEP